MGMRGNNSCKSCGVVDGVVGRAVSQSKVSDGFGCGVDERVGAMIGVRRLDLAHK